MLNESRVWDDQGTGHVAPLSADKLNNGLSLVVRSEVDGKVLLESKIQLNTAYQKQQETLIVWSELDNFDYALSFQDKAGCDEIWAKICQVQGKDPSVEITQDLVEQDSEDIEEERFDDMHDSSSSVCDLPPCELSRLDDIAELFSSSLLTPVKRERLALAIENDSYIRRLLDLFHMCEDLDNLDGLHKLYSIFKAMFLLNKTALFEILFTDDLIMDVIGVLEYDPSSAQPTKHRQYICSQAKLKEVIPLSNSELVKKIHQTYRVQYIQDIILPMPSMFEENLLSTLSSFIYFNKMEIVTMIQEDEKLLQSLFKQLTDDELDDVTRRDLILFLKEFCTFSQTLAQQNRDAFFKVLSNLGILNTLESLLGLDDAGIKSLAVDIFSFIVEFNPSIVRDFVLNEAHSQEDDDLLINMILEQLTADTDPELGGAVQLISTVRLLIDPENMVSTMQKTEKSEFLQFFYRHSMHVLTAPLFANTAHDVPAKDDYQTAQLLSLILELLTFCVEHHTYHIKTYVMSKNLLRRVLVLLKSRHSFLNLAALRLLRRMVGLKDEFYNRYIVKYDLFSPVAEAFLENGHKYNLLNSAIIELFDFIRTDDIKSLVTYVVEKQLKSFESVTYVQTFKMLRQRYDQQQDRLLLHSKSSDSLDGLPSPLLRTSVGRFHRDARSLDEEEELWFEQDDEMDECRLTSDLLTVPHNKLDKVVKDKLDMLDSEACEYKATNTGTAGGKLINRQNKHNTGGGGVTSPRTKTGSLLNSNKTSTISININTSTGSNTTSSTGSNTNTTTTATNTGSSTEGVTSLVSVAANPIVSNPDVTPSQRPMGGSPASTTNKSGGGLVGLVDYPDEDSDEETTSESLDNDNNNDNNDEDDDDDDDDVVQVSKRARLST